MEGIQVIKTSPLATMVALRYDSMEGLEDRIITNVVEGERGAAGGSSGVGIGTIANLRDAERKASTLRVRLEKSPLSGLALGLVPVYDVGDHDEGAGNREGDGGGGGGFFSRKEDLESKLTGGNRDILRTRVISARDRRRTMNRNTKIVGGVIQ